MARVRKSKAELLPQSDPTAPLGVAAFLAAAQPVLAELTNDLLARADADAGVRAALRQRHEFERKEQRTGDGYEVWRRNVVVQIAAGWLLSCVFVRTLEDRGLLGRNRIAGPGAVDSQEMFHRLSPHLGEREYLLMVFREMEHFQAARGLFDRQHNLAWRLGPSSQSARSLLVLFRGVDPEQPAFRFGQVGTRFLGDIYQDLSEEVRKRFALLQTPDFIESFILDRTLDPAIEEFGLDETTVIDPTCGSGHFLLGAFERLYDRWCVKAPGESREALVERALASVFGVDVNPYAVAIARFRLTLAALDKLGVRGVAEAPLLSLNVVVADSLLHNFTRGQRDFGDLPDQKATTWLGDIFTLDDEAGAKAVLSRTFAAVVGNPPYITVEDKTLRDRYRRMYSAAYREYPLSVPFIQRFFDCAQTGGFVGQITSNSFMKREFGKLLIEKYLGTQDLALIVNTSGVIIPGHGTPTVLLFGRARTPEHPQVNVVLARRGEPATPDDPARGVVWRSIAEHWNEQGFENDYITVGVSARQGLGCHPWSLEGGGAGQFKEALESRGRETLSDLVDSVGFMCITKQDELYCQESGIFTRLGVDASWIKPFVIGELVRDWTIAAGLDVLFPYADDESTKDLGSSTVHRYLWPFRTLLENRAVFGGKTFRGAGRIWYEYGQIPSGRVRGPAIAFAFVATHNHFVLDHGGKIFKQSAPIIKLPRTATEDDHLALLAYLNSSTACFWLKQVCSPKGGSGIGRGIQDEAWESRYEFDGTKLLKLPLPKGLSTLSKLGALAEQLAIQRSSLRPTDSLVDLLKTVTDLQALDRGLAEYRAMHDAVLDRQVAVQEAIDFAVYGLFEVQCTIPDTVDVSRRGSRAFEHNLRLENSGSAWFERNGYEPPSSPALAVGLPMPEDPAFKRRWMVPDWQIETRDVMTQRVLDVVEESFSKLHDVHSLHSVRLDERSDRMCMDWLINACALTLPTLVVREAVPYLSTLRFTSAGLDRYAAWHQTWDLQRREDAGEKIGTISVPPKYDQKDYQDATYWRLRGKLDVPKERFISYPGCESEQDQQPVYGWAGWDHLQRAQALATLYRDRKTNESWPTDRLVPMLAGIHELIPWLKQWHNDEHPEFGPQGDFFDDWLSGELREHKLTRADLEAWRPSGKPTRKKTSKKAPAKSKAAESTPEHAAAPGAAPQAELTLTAPAPLPKKPRGRKKKSSS